MNNKILFVDDEENILSAYNRNFRNKYQVLTANNALNALEVLSKNKAVSIVISDFKMPGDDGITLLKSVRQLYPETVRIIITGYADLDTAINAVNEGNVFRFLSKPCSLELLAKTIDSAMEQYNLIVAEKELLNNTLKGSVKLLIEILSMIAPTIFSKATRYRTLARNIALRLRIENTWELEIASMLSLIGCIALPNDILDKMIKGIELEPNELKILNSHPQIGESLIKNIPRLERIATSIVETEIPFDPIHLENRELYLSSTHFISNLIKIIKDYDELISKGNDINKAISIIKSNNFAYSPIILDALESELKLIESGYILRSIGFRKLRIGMMLAEDIKDDRSYVLVAKGNEITDVSLMKLITISKTREIIEPIKIYEKINN